MGDVERAQERWALILQYLTSQRQIFTPPIQLCAHSLSYIVLSTDRSVLTPTGRYRPHFETVSNGSWETATLEWIDSSVAQESKCV